MAIKEQISPDSFESISDQLFEEQLHFAGIENAPAELKRWIKGDLDVYNIVLDLADNGFGEEYRKHPKMQEELLNIFAGYAALDKAHASTGATTPLETGRMIEETLPQAPAAAKVGSTAAKAASKPAAAVPPRTTQPEARTTTPDDVEQQSRFAHWGKVAVAAAVGVGVIGGTAAGLMLGDSSNDTINKRVATAEVAQSALEIQGDFFSLVDPAELPKESENNFGPKSQAGLDGDRHGILRDYEALFRGKNSGAYILTDKVAFMQHVTGAQFDLPDGVVAPTFPGVDAMHDKAVYDAYEQQSQAFAEYLKQHPEVALQLFGQVINTMSGAEMGDIQYTDQTVASNYVDHNTRRVYWDLSVNEGAHGAPYRMWTITVDGHTGQMGDMLWCDYQNFEVNASPLATIRPVSVDVVQPAEVTDIPVDNPTLIPVDNPPFTPPNGDTPVVNPPVTNNEKSPYIVDYQRPGTDSTTDSGVGQKPQVTADPIPDAAPPPVKQETQVQSPAPQRGLPNNPLQGILSVFNRPGAEAPISAPRSNPNPNSGVKTSGKTADESQGGKANETHVGKPQN
jgi:hypothetical protein